MQRAGVTILATIASMVAAGAGSAAAQNAEHVTVRDVQITASRVSSSTGLPREPAITVRNRAAETRTFEIVSLESIGVERRRVHHVVGNARRVLRPGARARIVISYRGDPVPSGTGGLGVRRFRVHVRVDGEEGALTTTTFYVCRIPVRIGD